MIWLLAIGAFLVAAIAVLLAARAAWRGAVRSELRALLAGAHPDIEVTAESSDRLELKLPDGETGTMYLGNLYTMLAAEGTDEAARHESIRTFVESVLSQQAEASQPLRMEEHGDRLMPRLQPEGFLAQADSKDPLVRAASGIPGLVTVFVLDSAQSVMYLTESRLRELGIDADVLRERALANLRRVTSESPVRDAVERRNVVMFKAGDTFDATRLLLVPEMLRDGEELAAVIPDRDTLGLMPVPGDWAGVRQLARTPASPYTLLERPLRVTRGGFEAV